MSKSYRSLANTIRDAIHESEKEKQLLLDKKKVGKNKEKVEIDPTLQNCTTNVQSPMNMGLNEGLFGTSRGDAATQLHHKALYHPDNAGKDLQRFNHEDAHKEMKKLRLTKDELIKAHLHHEAHFQDAKIGREAAIQNGHMRLMGHYQFVATQHANASEFYAHAARNAK